VKRALSLSWRQHRQVVPELARADAGAKQRLLLCVVSIFFNVVELNVLEIYDRFRHTSSWITAALQGGAAAALVRAQ